MEWMGFIFGIFGLLAYYRVDRLEKRLKELQVLERNFDSEN